MTTPDESMNQGMKTAMEAVVQRLQALADEQVRMKSSIEERWIEDIQQYQGQYDHSTLSRLREAAQSQLFVNITRRHTNDWISRIFDMLFPTDDRNWAIEPTPVPEMSEVDPAAVMAEAAVRAEAMEAEIHDQLVESRYNTHCRDVIEDGCKLGTGILKGPTTMQETSRRWGLAEEGDMAGAWVLGEDPNPQPAVRRVDPWSYFPDMSARTPDERQFDFERHLMTRRDLQRLAQTPSFDEDTIRGLLREGQPDTMPSYLSDLRDITGGGSDSAGTRYVVWEYWGPLEKTDLEIMAAAFDRDDVADIDELSEITVNIWFCQGQVLKFAPHHMDSGDSIYSIWNFERDEAGLFGVGVPNLLRHPQAALNGAWRKLMDNMGLCAGPQIVITKGQVTPIDGDYRLRANKVWESTDPNQKVGDAFSVFNIDSRQGELANIISLASQFAREETHLPMMLQDERGAFPQQTAQGMAIIQNSLNVILRRCVRQFDDDVTSSFIGRMFDWNMQFNDREEIKGDMRVVARGSAVLLVREVQAPNLMQIAQVWTQHPILAGMVKAAEVARKALQAHQIDAGELLKTDDEMAAEQQQQQAAAEQQQPEDPAIMKAQIQLQIAQMEAQTRLQIAEIERDTAMMRLAEEMNMKVEELRARLDIERTKTQSRERIFSAEVAVKDRHGQGI